MGQYCFLMQIKIWEALLKGFGLWSWFSLALVDVPLLTYC
jgi:hypothetical protein